MLVLKYEQPQEASDFKSKFVIYVWIKLGKMVHADHFIRKVIFMSLMVSGNTIIVGTKILVWLLTLLTFTLLL